MGDYKFTISMNVMENLGEGLYSSVPAVIAETIANSYDADAEEVKIDINIEDGTITIQDDGNGMSEQECNKKYLNIGYHRREKGDVESPIYHRPVMGRKGIGKLSLFSIAKNIELHSVKAGPGGEIEKNGFVMNLDKIKDKLKDDENNQTKEIPLEPVDQERIEIEKGTKIVLTDLKKNLVSNTINFLRRRLARKFSVLGDKYHFKVFVNDNEISIEDRDYFDKIQYLWHFGDYGQECLGQCGSLEKEEKLNGEITLDDGTICSIEGWIGTVNERSDLPEGENTIILHSRGKSIHDDLLKDIDNSGIVSKYVIGEIIAEFLDEDDKPDIATSDRQSINENTERFEKIREFVKRIISHIRIKWQEWREDDAMNKACEIPAIKEWFTSLGGDNKKYARQLFGKIDKLPIPDIDYKKELYKNAILAFQTLAISNSLSKLDEIDPDQLEPFLSLLSEMDQLEAAHYHDIVRGRINVLKKFEELVDADAKEKTLQRYIFDHLWLLDPSWERADSRNKRIEQSVKKEFEAVKLTPEESRARIDIRYRSSAGKHIIVELKRYSVDIDIDELMTQLRKYKRALEKCLQRYPSEKGPIEIVSILGSKPNNAPEEEIESTLKSINARYVTYDQLIENTLNGYSDYLDKNREISEIMKLIESIN